MRASPAIREGVRSVRAGGFAALLGLAILAAGQADAAPIDPAAHYERLGEARVRSIQYDLIWSGDLNAVTDGVVGPRSLAAIRAFERRIGSAADGVLSGPERRRLAADARAQREAMGYEIVIDEATGARIGVPFARVDGPNEARSGARYAAPDGSVEIVTHRVAGASGLRDLHRRELVRLGREVTYELRRENWFVATGREGGRDFYTRARTDGTETRAFTVTYDRDLEREIEPVVVAMSDDFEAFAAEPRARVAAASPEPPGASPREPRRAGDGPAPGDRRTEPAPATAAPPTDPPRRAEAAGDEPDRRDGPSPIASPTAMVVPRHPVEGGDVRVTATGFPPGVAVEASFARSSEGFRRARVATADGAGRVDLDLPLPERLRAGDAGSIAVTTLEGRMAVATDYFTVAAPVEPPRPRGQLTVLGILTTEGETCQAMRAVNGELHTLTGAVVDYLPGTTVRVVGRGTDGSECGQGTTIEVERMARP